MSIYSNHSVKYGNYYKCLQEIFILKKNNNSNTQNSFNNNNNNNHKIK